nr:hypothetical protein [Tanacetum cinerariifolium]
MDSIKQCLVERARHEQELQNRLKRLSERKLQIQECEIQEVKASDASSREKDSSGIVSDKGNDRGLENQGNTSRDESTRRTKILKHDDERVALANLIANLKLDTDENKKI